MEVSPSGRRNWARKVGLETSAARVISPISPVAGFQSAVRIAGAGAAIAGADVDAAGGGCGGQEAARGNEGCGEGEEKAAAGNHVELRSGYCTGGPGLCGTGRWVWAEESLNRFRQKKSSRVLQMA